MMRSMYSGVSGLRVHQTKMDVIGNNIANVNTVGFKSSRVTFSEVFNQTLQNATSPGENLGGSNPMQIGLGTTVSSIDVDMNEGASQRTDNPLDIKINGNSFFIVGDATGNKFTRAGAFKIDKAGNLVTPAGLYVKGWSADPATNTITKDTVQKIQILSAENLYADPDATTNVSIAGNLNKDDTALDNAGTGYLVQASFYDSLGYQYTVDMRVKKTATPNQFQIDIAANSVKDSNGTTTGLLNPALTQTFEIDPATGKLATASATSFTILPTNTGVSTFNTMTFDFSSIMMMAGNTAVTADKGDLEGLNGGYPPGSLNDYEIASDGKIIGKYTNSTTRLLGQIAITEFANPAGLQKVGDNLFEATSNSGDFDGVGQDISASGGSFSSGVLEMSNVDLSKEFTEMITTQRGFQANSRIITTSDEILQELVNLKR